MNKILKYLVIVSSAIILNFLVWKIGSDCLSDKMNGKSNSSIILNLVWLGLGSLLIIGIFRWLSDLIESIPKTQKLKLGLAITITVLLFGNTTISNLKELSSSIINDNQRTELCNKISDANYLAYGTKAESLTFHEYTQVKNLMALPSISSKSYDISFLYSYDGFLPDYSLEVTYKIPKSINVKTYEEKGTDFDVHNYKEEFEDYNLINYAEINR